MEYADLQKLFMKATAVAVSSLIRNTDKFIRNKYPVGGAPDWKITDDIVFINSSEDADPYGQQVEVENTIENGTVMARRTRTRVWQVLFTAYGPNSYSVSNRIKDGFFSEALTRLLNAESVFLIPTMTICRQSNEFFSANWWERWDVTLYFYEGYTAPAEDVGHIDSVSIRTVAQRRSK